jgi:2-dehydropantoate 2-reductase
MKYIQDVYTELYTLAKAKSVNLTDDVVDNHMAVFKKLPVGAITSLYRDLKQPGNKTEFEAVVGKGVRLAEETGVNVPCLNAVYEKYKGR